MMPSLPQDYRALVIGSTGGIGSAVLGALKADPRCRAAVGRSRSDGLHLEHEDSIARELAAVTAQGAPDLVFLATGALAIDGHGPEKSLRSLDPDNMARQFAVNAIGPALVLKHLLPLLDRSKRTLVAILSARVGSIGDNRLGGWISYRSSKAALNQIVRTASIEIRRTHPKAVLVALHPGTVATRLSDPFAGNRDRSTPAASAAALLGVLDALPSEASGGFFAYDGSRIEW